jgi:CRP-like cAMP-binding protein
VKPQERERVERLLREGAWFRGLPASFQDAILDRSILRAYSKGEIIAAEGSPSEGLSAVLEGRVAWTRSVPGAGGEVLLYVAGPGAWFGHLALVRDTPHQFNVVAHAPARILVLPRAEYQRLIEEDPGHFRRIADVALERLELLIRIYAESRSLPAQDLIPARLATLAELRRAESHQAGGAIRLALSQGEVAAIFGVSRQTLNTALKRLEAAGLIEVGFRELLIPDAARLPEVVAARSALRPAGRDAGSAIGHVRPRRARTRTSRRS